MAPEAFVDLPIGSLAEAFAVGAIALRAIDLWSFIMLDVHVLPGSVPAAVPLKAILPWAAFGGLMCLLSIYFVGAEEGATSLIKGMYIHEFVHDARHLLGFPCH